MAALDLIIMVVTPNLEALPLGLSVGMPMDAATHQGASTLEVMRMTMECAHHTHKAGFGFATTKDAAASDPQSANPRTSEDGRQVGAVK